MRSLAMWQAGSTGARCRVRKPTSWCSSISISPSAKRYFAYASRRSLPCLRSATWWCCATCWIVSSLRRTPRLTAPRRSTSSISSSPRSGRSARLSTRMEWVLNFVCYINSQIHRVFRVMKNVWENCMWMHSKHVEFWHHSYSAFINPSIEGFIRKPYL